MVGGELRLECRRLDEGELDFDDVAAVEVEGVGKTVVM